MEGEQKRLTEEKISSVCEVLLEDWVISSDFKEDAKLLTECEFRRCSDIIGDKLKQSIVKELEFFSKTAKDFEVNVKPTIVFFKVALYEHYKINFGKQFVAEIIKNINAKLEEI